MVYHLRQLNRICNVAILAFFLCAGQRMTGPKTFAGGGITTTANWTANLQTQTLTVPAGNPGTILFDSDFTTDGSLTYSKNGTAYVIFSPNGTLSVATGDTLAFSYGRFGTHFSGTVKDNTTGTTVGTVSF